VLGLAVLFGCQGSSVPSVERGCGGSGQRSPDTSSPVRRRDGARMEGTDALGWEELVGEAPRVFDTNDPREPE